MKFNVAWAKVAAQNVSLKVATVVLSIVCCVQIIALVQMALRPPLVVERACFSRVLEQKNADPTAEEIRAFLSEVLPLRFNTDLSPRDGLVSISEMGAREKERSALQARQISQRVLVADVKVEGKNITANLDRIIAVGKIKTALPLNLKVTIEQTGRSEANPYGLILSKTEQLEEKEGK